jgi:hypothetical protein
MVGCPVVVGLLTGEYRPGVHGPALRCALCIGFAISDYADRGSRIGQVTSQI